LFFFLSLPFSQTAIVQLYSFLFAVFSAA